jgi:hypothetical protein
LPSALLAALCLAGACVDDSPVEPTAGSSRRSPGSVSVGVVVSDPSPVPGQRIVVEVAVGGQPAYALQGRLRFDPRRLRLVGPDASGALTVVNDARAGEGVLHLLALDLDGLRAGSVALAFEALRSSGIGSLRWEHEVAVLDDLAEASVDASTELRVDPTLSPGRRPSAAGRDWALLRGPEGADRGPARVAGEFVRDMVYGDANMDCLVTFTDVLEVARFSVGIYPVSAGSEGTTLTENEFPACDPGHGADRAIAGNVVPANLPGLGEAADSCAPGVDV